MQAARCSYAVPSVPWAGRSSKQRVCTLRKRYSAHAIPPDRFPRGVVRIAVLCDLAVTPRSPVSAGALPHSAHSSGGAPAASSTQLYCSKWVPVMLLDAMQSIGCDLLALLTPHLWRQRAMCPMHLVRQLGSRFRHTADGATQCHHTESCTVCRRR